MNRPRTLLLSSSLAFLANSRGDLVGEVDSCDDPEVLFLYNELPQIDTTKKNAIVKIPYGRHEHSRGVQRFEKEDAVIMVENFNRGVMGIGTKLMGLPWFIGHPDHKAFRNESTDTRSYGRVKELVANEDHLALHVRFNNSGKTLIREEAFHGWSPNWAAEKISGEWRPRFLASVGFTNEPNMEVAPATLANKKSNPESKRTMDQTTKLLAALMGCGALPLSATDADLLKGVETLANSKKEADDRIKTLETENADLKKAKDELDSLANERKEKATKVVDGAIQAGKILPADRESKIEELANSKTFLEDLDKFASLANGKTPAAVKTTSQVGELGGRDHDQKVAETPAARTKRITQLANAKMKKDGLSREAATAAVIEEHPDLVTA